MPKQVLLAALLTTVKADFGDSSYGFWTTDAFGNPAFQFTGGSSSVAGAQYPTSPVVIHHAGNDRVSAMAFSDGSVTVRQDEGGPKVINGYNSDPSVYQFRGGFGYLSNSTTVIASTAIDGTVGLGASPFSEGRGMGDAPNNISLVLGMGYVAKAVTVTSSLGLTQTILAPFGDDSVVLSLLTLTGSGTGPRPDARAARTATTSTEYTWTEVWSSGDRFELGWGPPGMPKGFQANWSHSFAPLVSQTTGLVFGLVDQARIADTIPPYPRPAYLSPDLPAPALHDPEPRPAFLVCLSCLLGDAALVSYTTCGSQLYCADEVPCTTASISGPVLQGVGKIIQGLDNSTSCSGSDAVLAMQARFPAASPSYASLAFAYGYLLVEDVAAAGGDIHQAVLNKVQPYVNSWNMSMQTTGLAWSAYSNSLVFGSSISPTVPTKVSHHSIAARVAAAQSPVAYAQAQVQAGTVPSTSTWSSWEGREAAWHSYMLRAGLSYDTYYGAHIINQGGNYLWTSGQQAAARDPIAHVAGMAWAGRSSSPYVLEILNYTMRGKRVVPDSLGRPAGSMQWGTQAFGADSSATFNQSDTELAVLMTACQYVLATRDVQSLQTVTVPWNGTVATLTDTLWDSFLHFQQVISTGQHGLVRLLNSDHNDGLYGTLGLHVTPYTMEHAESVMNSALAAYVLPLYASVLTLSGQADRAETVQSTAAAYRQAVVQQWSSNGTVGWYRRAFFGNVSEGGYGWRGDASGDGTLWTETQAWAILGQVPQAQGIVYLQALVQAIDGMARAPSPIGAINTPPHAMPDGGVGYGGIWYCGETALVTALGTNGYPDMALDEWRKASLAQHANEYPYLWMGVTSGPDVYNSVYTLSSHGSAVPGSTRCHWNDPGNSTPCMELAFPILNMWSHTLGTYSLPSLVGAQWTVDGMSLAPTLTTEDTYTVWTPLMSVARAGSGQGAASCAYSGHWAPYQSVGTPACITVQLLPADLALCNSLSVNGLPMPLNRTQTGVSFCGPLADARQLAGSVSWAEQDVPVIVWELSSAYA